MPLFRASRAVSRSFAAVLAALVVCAGVGAAVPAQASVSVHQVFAVPHSGTFTVAGHGFGHGHGMSQYGAQGAALKGLSAGAILAFYYPGTRLAKTGATISVLISADTSRDLEILPQPGLSVTDLGNGTVYQLPAISGVRKWRLNVKNGHSVVAYDTNRWHRYRPAGHWTLVGDGQFQATSGQLTLITPSGQEPVRGVLRAASPSPGSSDRDTVNVLPLDEYVQGVVPREMPTSWDPAAVQAQAVAARTYALFEAAANAGRDYQICDTTACQVYGGLNAETAAGNQAVTATAGQYLTYRGKPAFTQFSASDGGWTSAGGMAYLPHKADPYDGWSGNHVHSWSVKVHASVLQHRYTRIGVLKSVTITSREGGGDWSGRVFGVTLKGTKGTQLISGASFQALYGLRSTWFTLRTH